MTESNLNTPSLTHNLQTQISIHRQLFQIYYFVNLLAINKKMESKGDCVCLSIE